MSELCDDESPRKENICKSTDFTVMRNLGSSPDTHRRETVVKPVRHKGAVRFLNLWTEMCSFGFSLHWSCYGTRSVREGLVPNIISHIDIQWIYDRFTQDWKWLKFLKKLKCFYHHHISWLTSSAEHRPPPSVATVIGPVLLATSGFLHFLPGHQPTSIRTSCYQGKNWCKLGLASIIQCKECTLSPCNSTDIIINNSNKRSFQIK